MTATIPPPKFEDLMKRYHGEIERLVDAAKLLCESKGGDGFFCPLGTSCNFKIYVKGKQNDCLLNVLEKAGIPAPYCSPCERTMPECGACKGPAPKCPKCGGPTFRANIDDQDMILCYNDACKWKGPAEIGQCSYSRAVIKYGILCQLPRDQECDDQDWNVTHEVCWCKREDVALAAIERYEQEDLR